MMCSLKQRRIIFIVLLLFAALPKTAGLQHKIETVRLLWPVMPDAVMYQLRLVDKQTGAVVEVIDHIYDNGYELPLDGAAERVAELSWQVRGMDITNKPLTEFTASAALAEAQTDTDIPYITGAEGDLNYSKVYPVYSWLPMRGAKDYEIQVYKKSGEADELVRRMIAAGGNASNYYEEKPFTEAGEYYWKVRARYLSIRLPSGWSRRHNFTVTHENVIVASLGDSITHGGGAVSAPPSCPLYDWQSYAGLPILNIGFSGDTVEKMAERFDRDVMPFKPEILIIMGGINNIRLGDTAGQVIAGLEKLKAKCLSHKIIPVFVTIAPVNPRAMYMVSGLNICVGWEREQKIVNDWIKKQWYYVDISDELADKRGWLKRELSVDGLHPDVRGKQLIGQAIGDYLRLKFADELK